MHPVLALITVSSQQYCISTYGLCLVAAVLCGTVITMRLSQSMGRDSWDIFIYCMLVAACGFIGAAVAGFIIFIPERISAGLLNYPPVLVSWGGMLGSIAALLLISRKWGEDLWVLADLLTPGAMIGLGIGRVGCFCAGCCYGIHTASPFGVYFTHPLAPASAMDQPLVPVQLISAAFLLLAGMTALILVRRAHAKGALFLCTAFGYALFRFTVEFFRADPRAFLLGLSDGQWFSVAVFTAVLSVLIKQALNRVGCK